MESEPLHLWCAYPDDLLDDSVAAACVALLDQPETARSQRFKFDKHRREYLATRALVRTALSHYRSLLPAKWRFRVNAHGKPALEDACEPGRESGLHFNLSNSLGLVVCLVAHGAEVGVDVEPLTRAEVMLSLAEKVFSDKERAQLESLSAAEKLDRALSLWTLKESYIKARGMGLALPLDQFSFLFGGAEGIRLEIDPRLNDSPLRWRFCQLDHAGHRIAAMVDGATAGELEVFEARPPLAQPVRVTFPARQWFPRVRSAARGDRARWDS